MARKRNSLFDPPTEGDYTKLGPSRVRPGPKGGYLWLCETKGCKVAASHLAATSGRKVCHRHGGSTAKQRDPEVHALAVAEGMEPPRAPGRPLKHGFYAVLPGHSVDELVEQYRQSQLDPDVTDDDMLYLRAHLEDLKAMRPDGAAILEQLQEGLEFVKEFRKSRTDEVSSLSGKALSVSQVLVIEGLYEDLNSNLTGLKDTMKELTRITAGLEARHERLVMLSKVRAETRLKNVAGQQMEAFKVMTDKFMTILTEMLPSDRMEALQARLVRELEILPGGGTKVKA